MVMRQLVSRFSYSFLFIHSLGYVCSSVPAACRAAAPCCNATRETRRNGDTQDTRHDAMRWQHMTATQDAPPCHSTTHCSIPWHDTVRCDATHRQCAVPRCSTMRDNDTTRGTVLQRDM